MKLTTILLLTACLQVSAMGFSQKITLSEKNVTLKKVLKQIHKQTGYQFFYEDEMLKKAGRINIDVKDAPLEKVLAICFKDAPLSYSIVNNAITVTPKKVDVVLQSQLPAINNIHGTVKDEKGNPLAGVSVIIKGTNKGTSTNADGNFTIEANVGEVLEFSFIGYQKKSIKLGNNTHLIVVMEIEATMGNNVVVIGYGTVKKSDLTGSVSVVKGSDVSSAPVASVDQALQGKAAGVQVTSVNGSPGAPTTIRIRGGNSITASNEPLYVVDGFIGGGNLTSINPDDILSIEILKDASATAIYGARGANGVVLITTKQGKPGQSNISLDSYTGMQQLPREVPLLTGPQLAAYLNERAALNGATPIYPDLSEVTNTDWQKAVTRTAPIQSTNLAFSGGSKKVTYYLSGNYFNQDGIIINSGFQRYQTRLNLNLKLTNWLSVGTNLNFSRSNRNNSKVSLYDVLKTAPTSIPIKDSSGNYIILSPISGQTFENPVADGLESLNNTYDDGLLGIWYIKASFKNGLQFKTTLNIDDDNSKQEIYSPGSLPLNMTEDIGGSASISSMQAFNIENENTVSYNRNFGKSHLDVLGGFTYQNEIDQSYSANASGFTNDALTYNNLSTGNPLLAINGSNYSKWTIVSFLGRANYSFNDKYLFTVSARQDGSSRLAANHKYALFPSAAFAWKLSNENFIKNLSWLSNLKFRASYGETGNQAIAIYSTLPSLAVSDAWFNSQQQIGYTLGTIPNPDLKWETTDQYDAGLDAGFLNGRLSMVFDAYYKRTHNLLLNVPISGTTGYSSRLANIGETQNKGLELMLDAIVIDQKNLSWDLTFNIAGNRNKILALGPGQPFINIADGYRLIVGKPAPLFWGSIYEGIFHTQAEINALPGYQAGLLPGDIKFKDVNGNGKYDGAGDDSIMGNPAPKFFGGFNSSLRYKRFTLNMYFEYSYGNDVINTLGPRWFAGDYGSNVGKIALGRWEPDNTQSNIPRAGADERINVNSEAYSFAVQNGSFLRLKTLQLRYDLSSKKIKWMKGASIYFTGSNLFILDHYSWGYDPEVSSNSASPVLGGQDTYAYPANRSFIFGINLNL